MSLDETQIDEAFVELTNVNGTASLQRFIKKYSEILAGTLCHTETLMYLVEKRRVVDGSPGDVVQRFFISNRFQKREIPIVLYDTQIKYGQRYVYDIKKIVIVFGNSYQYDEAVTQPDPANEDAADAMPSLPTGLVDPPELLEISEDITDKAGQTILDFESAGEPSASEILDGLSRLRDFGRTLPKPSPSGPIQGPPIGAQRAAQQGTFEQLGNDLENLDIEDILGGGE